MYLERIATPQDVRDLPQGALAPLCAEIRAAIVSSCARRGGHLGPNLAVVELTVAIHRVFESPRDRIVFDVSHQTYAHKMLTGRAAAFLDPTRDGEVSGFSSPAESEHDLFAMGHTSTAASLACGLARARALTGEGGAVVAVIGDGSLSGGLAFEGLDNAAGLGGGVVLVVNDNEWSIAPDEGGVYATLAELRRTRGQSPCNPFRALGLDYRYVEEGNDAVALEAALREARGLDHPVVVHVHTTKGAGYAPAEADPEGWHHVGPFDERTGECASRPDAGYAALTAELLLARMREDRGLVAVSAATPYVMGFSPARREEAGDQFVDVGIAEGHAVTFAAGLARGGATPVLGVYATFLQRAYDQLWHDVCLNGLGVTVLVYGASAAGNSDATHLGFFDVPMLGAMPGLAYLAPTCREEYAHMLRWAVAERHGPLAIRVPVMGPHGRADVSLPESWPAAPEVARRGSEACVVALGDAFDLGRRCADELEGALGHPVTLVNPRQATTVDEGLLAELAQGHRVLVTLEDGVLDGGFGQRVAAASSRLGGPRVLSYGLPRAFLDRFDAEGLLASCRMTPQAVCEDVLAALGR